MLSLKSTFPVILIVLSVSVGSAYAHINGFTIAQADVELSKLGNASELKVRAAGKGSLGSVGTFQHLSGTIHEIDIYLHVWIAEVFPENSNIVVFKYSILLDRKIFHLPDTRNSLEDIIDGKKTLAGACLRGSSTADVRIQYKRGADIITEVHDPDNKNKCFCPGSVVCPDEAQAQAVTPAQAEAIKQELKDMVTMANDRDIVGAFNVNGKVFLQRGDTPYIYSTNGIKVTIGGNDVGVQAVQLNLNEGVESAFADVMPAAAPSPNYTPKRTAITWGELKKG